MFVLNAGASTETPSGIISALAITIENYDLHMFDLLLHYAVKICFDSGRKKRHVLQLAAEHRSTTFLKRLIRIGLDVGECWGRGPLGTALQRAVAVGNVEAARLLI